MIVKEPYSPFTPRRHERHIYWLESAIVIGLIMFAAWKIGFMRADSIVEALIDRPVAAWAKEQGIQ